MGFFSNTMNSLFRALGYVPAVPDDHADDNQHSRTGEYRVRELFYNNGIYRPRSQGGLLEEILRDELGRQCDVNQARMIGYYNPVRTIVDAYQFTIPGAFGELMRVAPKVDGREVNPSLLGDESPIATIWRWSNFDSEKQKMCRFAANLGTVGLRVVSRNSEMNNEKRVRVMVEHPRRIVDFEEDDFGNVTEVMLRYTILRKAELGDENPQEIEVVERLGKDRFSMEYDGAEQLSSEQRSNPMGFCPYVILKHRDIGNPFGEHAYVGSEPILHAINWLVTCQERSVRRHAFPQWFAATSGDRPSSLQLGEESVIWAKMVPDTPSPMFQGIVPALNQDATRQFWMELTDKLRERQPEVVLNEMKLLSHTSAESMARAIKPVESRIMEVRPAYDHALIRSIQMALSWGVMLDMWDLGSGTGTREASDRAWDEGMEQFVFAPRPALPQTMFERIQQLEAEKKERNLDLRDANMADDIVDDLEQLKIAGYGEEEARVILDRKRREDVTVDNEL